MCYGHTQDVDLIPLRLSRNIMNLQLDIENDLKNAMVRDVTSILRLPDERTTQNKCYRILRCTSLVEVHSPISVIKITVICVMF